MITTRVEYEAYERAVAEFFEKEELKWGLWREGDGDARGFSHRPCECCLSRLAGDRIEVFGVPKNPSEDRANKPKYYICLDCEYYITYGQLDDMTMMGIKEEPNG